MGSKMRTIRMQMLFEVAKLEDGKQQEVACPNCGEHYVYPIYDNEEDEQK